MEREVLDTVHAVKVVFRILVKVYPSISNLFKGSLVRKIASFLPLRPAPRIHINIPLCSTPYESFYEDSYLPSMRREFSALFGSVMSPQFSSTPQTQRAKIQHLEKQLLQLQQQVANIILQIPTSDYDSQHTVVNTWLNNQGTLSPNEQAQPLPLVPVPSESQQQEFQQQSLPLPPPPPPPPPPPMPPQNFLTPKPKPVLLCTPGKLYGKGDKVKKSPASLLSDVIQEIARERPALRPVKRSPGGNPLKTPKKHFHDPSDILSKVLRKRFSALHSDSLSETCSNDNIDISMSSFHSPAFSCASSPASAV